ncbi:MAG: PQQ-like beta-propeller repeat protein [Planctomycetales bacterium]|nr:PQQ-like beta-propeller repeat protein [Planctomycetales bacterium]
MPNPIAFAPSFTSFCELLQHRRRMSQAGWLLAIALHCMVLPLAAQQPDSPAAAPESLWTRDKGEDWPWFLGLRRDGKSQETGFKPEGWAEGKAPRLVWKLAVGEGYGACSISRGRLFHFDRDEAQFRLRCLNAETAKELWRFEYPAEYQDHYGYDGGPRCSPVVDDDRVYLFDASGMLHCLDVVSGKMRWKLDTTKRFGVVQNFFGVGSNPVIYEDSLILMVGGSPEADQGLLASQLQEARGNGSGVVAVNKHTGELIYKFSDELASYASLQLATIDDRPWCFAFSRGGLLGFDPRKGTQDFRFAWRAKILESVNASTPIVQGSQVLISETYGPGAALLKVAATSDPEVVWKDDEKGRDKSLQTHWNTPVYHEGHVYACSGRHTNNAELRCVDWKTGEVKWTRPGLSRTSLTYLDGHLLCLGEYGDLFVIKATPEKFSPVGLMPPTVDPEGKRLLKYPCWAAPVVSHGLMWIRGEGQLLCYELIEAN